MIFFFSATGNSKYVAERTAAVTGDECISIAQCVRAQRFEFAPEANEAVGIISPVYFWGLPVIVSAFLKRLQLAEPSYIWFAATYGTTTGQSGRFAAELLKENGLTLSARFSVKMPDTWTPVFDLSSAERVHRINRAAEPQIDLLIRRIQSRECGDFMRAKVPLGAVLLYRPHYEHARSTSHFTVTDACIGCGLCAKGCPVSAIELRGGRPVWVKDRCVMCLACLHRCPKFAIRRGVRTAAHGQYVHPPYTVT